MAILSYQKLQNEYFKSLELDYKNNSDDHPLYVLLKRAYRRLESTQNFYYFEYFLGLAVWIPLLFYSSEQWYLGAILFFSLTLICTTLFLLIFNVILPSELRSLKDRIYLVQEKFKNGNLGLEAAVEMIKSPVKSNIIEREYLIKQYYSLISPIIENERKDKKTTSAAQFICLMEMIEGQNVSLSRDEYDYLASSLLLINKGGLKDHKTLMNKIHSVYQSERAFSQREWKLASPHIEKARNIARKTYNRIDTFYTKFDNIYSNK